MKLPINRASDTDEVGPRPSLKASLERIVPDQIGCGFRWNITLTTIEDVMVLIDEVETAIIISREGVTILDNLEDPKA